MEPARVAVRLWSTGAAAALLVVGLSLRWDLGVASRGAGTFCLAVAAAEAATAVVPLPYLWRAMVGASVCLAAVLIGLVGGGPLALLAAPGISGPWTEIFRLIAAILLPAAILFRSHYRAYHRGRVLLAVAFALSLPFLFQQAALFVQADNLVAQIGSGATIAVILLTVVAFLGAPTTAITAFCAVLLGISVALDIGLRQTYVPPPLGSGPLSHALTAAAFVACTSPIAMGLFQLLAAIYARDARLVDVRQPPQEDEAPPSQPSDSSGRP
jgi:hypothetical protein